MKWYIHFWNFAILDEGGKSHFYYLCHFDIWNEIFLHNVALDLVQQRKRQRETTEFIYMTACIQHKLKRLLRHVVKNVVSAEDDTTNCKIFSPKFVVSVSVRVSVRFIAKFSLKRNEKYKINGTIGLRVNISAHNWS